MISKHFACRTLAVILAAQGLVACHQSSSDDPMLDAGPAPEPDPGPGPQPEPEPRPEPEPQPEPANRAPQIDGIEIDAASFQSDCRTGLFAEAHDADGDALSYRWSVAGEAIEVVGDFASLAGGPKRARRVELVVSDGRGGETRASLDLAVGACELPEGAIANDAGDRAYLMAQVSDTFDNHRREAARLGGHLATITTDAELAFVRGFGGVGWIGLWSPYQDHAFQTITGEPKLERFCPGEPNNAAGNEFAVELWDIDCFNDNPGSRATVAVYEFELPGGPEDVSDGGAFDRPGFDPGGADRTILRLTQAQTVRLAVTDRRGGCDGIGDPTLQVLFAGEIVAANDDANGSVCSELFVALEAGVYDVNVRGYGGDRLGGHRLAVELDAEPADVPAALPPVEMVNGDGTCPVGSAPLRADIAAAFIPQICEMLGTWYIVRLADGAAVDGPGYGCNIRPREENPLGQTLCAR